jgi:hypothetical protein
MKRARIPDEGKRSWYDRLIRPRGRYSGTTAEEFVPVDAR